MISFIRGDVCAPIGDGTKYIAHIVNDQGGWGRGFVVSLSRRWHQPEHAYRELTKLMSPGYVHGTIQDVLVEPDIHVVNMFAQHGYHSKENPVPLDYSALEGCLTQLNELVSIKSGATVHIPDMIGCGLAGGERTRVISLLEKHLTVPVFAYQLE